MKCSYCTLPAKAKCACIKSFMCQSHLGEHLVEINGHSYEILAIELGDERLYKLRSKIHENLNLIDRVKNEIMLKSKDLIKLIESLYNQTLIKLDGYSKSYLDILYRNKFCQSEIQTIEQVEKMNLVSQTLDIGEFQRQVQLYYSKDFVSYSQLLDERKLVNVIKPQSVYESKYKSDINQNYFVDETDFEIDNYKLFDERKLEGYTINEERANNSENSYIIPAKRTENKSYNVLFHEKLPEKRANIKAPLASNVSSALNHSFFDCIDNYPHNSQYIPPTAKNKPCNSDIKPSTWRNTNELVRKK